MSKEKYTCCNCFKIFKFGDFPEHDKEMQEDKKEFKDSPFISLQYLCEPCAKKLIKELDEDDKRSKAHLN